MAIYKLYENYKCLYSEGVILVIFMKFLLNERTFEYPHVYAISVIDKSVFFKR